MSGAWIDSHCHVTAPAFDADRDAVLERAREAGCELLVAIGAGYGLDGNDAALALAEARDDVLCTAGVHPHDARLLDDAGRTRLRDWLARAPVVAVGECGLDYHYDHSPRETQRAVFAEQVALARELDLPVSIHVRDDGEDAYRDLLEIWVAEGSHGVTGILHCYTHDLPFARRALDRGLDVSFSGIVTFRNADPLRDVARALPLERILVETDAPFLAPQGFRGKRNEPARVADVGRALARVKGVSEDEMALATRRNTRRAYRLDGR